MKVHLRRIAARTVEALQQALGPALDSITAQSLKINRLLAGVEAANLL